MIESRMRPNDQEEEEVMQEEPSMKEILKILEKMKLSAIAEG